MFPEIIEESAAVLAEYEKVPIAFRVESYFDVEAIDSGLGGFRFVERPITPYIKDYDTIDNDRPSRWASQWDISNWGILSAFAAGQRIGGVAVAWRTPELMAPKERDDLAWLWDIRIDSAYRGKGIGHRLFASAVAWARERQCRLLKIETQNVNVPACRFYARQGCELGAIRRYAYAEALNEVQLLWYRDL